MQADCSDRAIGIAGSTRRGGRAISPYALRLFGRSVRESNCDCDRSNEPSLLQTVFLRNDNEMLTLVSNPRTGWIAQIASELQPKPARSPRAGKKPSGSAKMTASDKDNVKNDTVKKNAVKKQAAKDGGKTVVAKNDTATSDASKKDTNKKDATKQDAAKKDPAQKDVAKKEPAKKDAKNVADRRGEILAPEQKAQRIAQLTARLQTAQEAGDARQVKLLTPRLEEVKRLPTRVRPAAVQVGVLKPSQLALSKKKRSDPHSLPADAEPLSRRPGIGTCPGLPQRLRQRL